VQKKFDDVRWFVIRIKGSELTKMELLETIDDIEHNFKDQIKKQQQEWIESIELPKMREICEKWREFVNYVKEAELRIGSRKKRNFEPCPPHIVKKLEQIENAKNLQE
jgi:hypothetical protein